MEGTSVDVLTDAICLLGKNGVNEVLSVWSCLCRCVKNTSHCKMRVVPPRHVGAELKRSFRAKAEVELFMAEQPGPIYVGETTLVLLRSL